MAFRSEAAKHYSLEGFIIASEGSRVGQINEEMHSTLLSGGFQVASRRTLFIVDFHLVAGFPLSGAHLLCTPRVIDGLGEWSAAFESWCSSQLIILSLCRDSIYLQSSRGDERLLLFLIFVEIQWDNVGTGAWFVSMFVYVNVCPFGMPRTCFPLFPSVNV